jgi:hypothetical protein
MLAIGDNPCRATGRELTPTGLACYERVEFGLRRAARSGGLLRLVRWLTGQEKGDGQLEFGGWTWCYDLASLGPSETEVTLTYDWSAVPQFIRERGIQCPPFGPQHLPNSLHHLAELAALTSRTWTPGR